MSALPEAFVDLEPFVGWALRKETERNRKRTSSSMEEIRSFCDALMPRVLDVFRYLDQFPLAEMPKSARNLQLMTLSLAEISSSIELYNQPTVPNALGFERLVPTEHTDGLYS